MMSDTKEVSILSWNIHGTNDALEGPKNKNADIITLFNSYYIFCLQETKMAFTIPNFRCFNKNRSSPASGGVCIGVHRSIEKLVTEIDTESEDFQAIRLRGIIKSPCNDLVLINVYDSPSTSTYKKANPEADNTLEESTSFLMKLGDSEIIIAGDFTQEPVTKTSRKMKFSPIGQLIG